MQKYGTLKAFGTAVSFVGWTIVAFSTILFFTVFGGTDIPPFVGIAGGVLGIALGFLMVVNGQVVGCFVDIERNTAVIAENSKKESA